MKTYDVSRYSAACADLIAGRHENELGPGEPDDSSRPALDAMNDESLFGGIRVADTQMADCCRSGLWLLYDFLDESHEVSQSIPTITGSYWHGIMHRREPDYSNAKYWFRQVGKHSVFNELAADSATIAGDFPKLDEARPWRDMKVWDANQFVDLCESAAGPAVREFARRLAFREWQLLFDFCYERAVGQG